MKSKNQKRPAASEPRALEVCLYDEISVWSVREIVRTLHAAGWRIARSVTTTNIRPPTMAISPPRPIRPMPAISELLRSTCSAPGARATGGAASAGLAGLRRKNSMAGVTAGEGQAYSFCGSRASFSCSSGLAGAGILAMILLTSPSGVSPSDRASYDSTTRWRSTSGTRSVMSSGRA